MTDHLEPLRELVRVWRSTIRQGQDSGGNWYDPVEQEMSGCADDLARVIKEIEGRVEQSLTKVAYHTGDGRHRITVGWLETNAPGTYNVLLIRRRDS